MQGIELIQLPNQGYPRAPVVPEAAAQIAQQEVNAPIADATGQDAPWH